MTYHNSIGQRPTILDKIRHIKTMRYNLMNFSPISTHIIH
nr:MAG TPA: hypothetical protein [Caudoviricetes sp.]